jgi:Probable cobalt transporter subunit (CbtB)
MMSDLTLPAAGDATGVAVRSLRDGAVVVTAVILALVALYAVFLDQGQLLSPVLGRLATNANYLHEFAHDGRHLLGAPCH